MKYFQFRIESELLPTNRRYIAPSIKGFDMYFVNRFQKNVDSNGVCWIDEVIDELSVDGNYITFNGIKYFIMDKFNGTMGHIDVLFPLGDGIYFYDILTPKDRAIRSCDWYIVYNILYKKSHEYYDMLPQKRMYYSDCGLYSKENDPHCDSGGGYTLVLDLDNFTDIDYAVYNLYQAFDKKASEIHYNYIDM